MGAADIGDPQSLNLYAYCGNDPINHIDPDGLFFKKLFKIFAVVLAVVSVLAFSWGFIAQGWFALAGAGIFALMGWGNGKTAQIAVAIFGRYGQVIGFRTPSTFGGAAPGVGPVSSLSEKKTARKKLAM
jgi:hypothetical protein